VLKELTLDVLSVKALGEKGKDCPLEQHLLKKLKKLRFFVSFSLRPEIVHY
jgi:hypothetical protein